jgi:hypothetical protein
MIRFYHHDYISYQNYLTYDSKNLGFCSFTSLLPDLLVEVGIFFFFTLIQPELLIEVGNANLHTIWFKINFFSEIV